MIRFILNPFASLANLAERSKALASASAAASRKGFGSVSVEALIVSLMKWK